MQSWWRSPLAADCTLCFGLSCCPACRGYAPFTGFRLGADGSVFYAVAASPPILHWHAAERLLSRRRTADSSWFVACAEL